MNPEELFNSGLRCKYEGRWQESFDFNRKATELAPEDQGAWWNMGIAATALGDWKEARRAWSACGLKPPDGDGPPEYNFGMTPVRLDPDGDGEVVWTERIDPARARIVSVPLPSSTNNYGDVVLIDGAADGYRMLRDRQVPVFNVLMTLKPSPLRKYVIELATSDRESSEALRACAEEMGGTAEDWGRTTNILCSECSRGIPHEHPAEPATPAHPHCGLAARDEIHAQQIIDAWLSREPGADLIRWFDATSSFR